MPSGIIEFFLSDLGGEGIHFQTLRVLLRVAWSGRIAPQEALDRDIVIEFVPVQAERTHA